MITLGCLLIWKGWTWAQPVLTLPRTMSPWRNREEYLLLSPHDSSIALSLDCSLPVYPYCVMPVSPWEYDWHERGGCIYFVVTVSPTLSFAAGTKYLRTALGKSFQAAWCFYTCQLQMPLLVIKPKCRANCNPASFCATCIRAPSKLSWTPGQGSGLSLGCPWHLAICQIVLMSDGLVLQILS